MIGKRRLIAFAMLVALTMFGVLNLDTVRLSASESPAIYISPALVRTEDPGSAIGTDYTFSIMTNYSGSDVWGYEFELTYDPNVLEGIEVVNGDLITGGVAMWEPGPFNNTTGELELTGNGFYYDTPPPPMTSGPGILANVTFTVVSYGISNIALVENKTRLIGYDPEHPLANQEGFYNIIDEYWPDLGHIKGSVCCNTIPGDANGDTFVSGWDLSMLSDAWMSKVGDWNYEPSADFNIDTYVSGWDLSIMSDWWMQSFP